MTLARIGASNQKALVDIEGVPALQEAVLDVDELEQTKRYALIALGAVISNGAFCLEQWSKADVECPTEELFPYVEKNDLVRWMLKVLITATPAIQSSVLLALGMACASCTHNRCKFLYLQRYVFFFFFS